jgi:hypothetical protein
MALQDQILPPDLPPAASQGQPAPTPAPMTPTPTSAPQPDVNAPQGPTQSAPGVGSAGGNAGDLLSTLLQGKGQPTAQVNPIANRKKMLSDFMQGLLYSVGQGLEARAQATPSQRDTAFRGAALLSGEKLRGAREASALKQQQQELNQQKADQALVIANQKAATESARSTTYQQMADTAQKNMEVMAGLHQAEIALKNEQAKNAEAKTEDLKKQSDLRVKELETKIAGMGVKAVPGVGMMDVTTKTIIPGTEDYKGKIIVTPELAQAIFPDNLDQQQKIIGQRQSLSELRPFLKPRTGIAITDDAVSLINLENGKEIRRIGDPHETGVGQGAGYNELDPKDQAKVDAVAEKVGSGQITFSNGLSALGGVRGGMGGAMTQALDKTLVLPPAVRAQNTDIERARNLLVPVHNLVDQIGKASTLEEKIQLSARLEQYVQAIGTQFARARGERGVVTDRDVTRVVGLIPGWKAANFAPEYGRENLKLIEDAFSRDQEALLGNYFTKYTAPGAGNTSAVAPPKALTSGGKGGGAAGAVTELPPPGSKPMVVKDPKTGQPWYLNKETGKYTSTPPSAANATGAVGAPGAAQKRQSPAEQMLTKMPPPGSPITEEMINTILRDNKGLSRETAIKSLKDSGYK